MKFVYNFLLLVFLLSNNTLIFSQNNKIDSLLNELKNEKEDTNKVNILNALFLETKPINSKKAYKYGKEGLSLAQKLEYNHGIAKGYFNFGEIYKQQENYEKAIEYYLKSIKTCEQTNDKYLIAICYKNIGVVYMSQGNFAKSVEYYVKSLELMETLNNKKGISDCLNNLGAIYVNQGNYKKSLEYFEQCLKIDNETGNKKGASATLSNIGIVYDEWGNKDKALDFFLQSLKLKKEIGDKRGIASSLSNIGVVYNRKKENELALNYYLQALKIYEELDNKWDMAHSLNNIGIIYVRKGDFNKAMVFINRSVLLAKDIKSNSLLRIAYKNLSDTYENMGNIPDAYKFFKLYSDIKDSIFNEESSRQITEIETKYQTEKKEQQIKLQEIELSKNLLEIKQGKILRYVMIGTIVFILIITILIFISLRNKKKANKLLKLKNSEISRQKEEIQSQADMLSKTNIELEKLSIVASKTDNAVIIANEQGIIEWVNEGFTKMYGYTLDEFTKKNGFNLIRETTETSVLESFIHSVEQQKSISYTAVYNKKDSTPVWVHTLINPIFDETNKLKKIIAVESDITKIKITEEELVKEKKKSDELLLNILPHEIANELKINGSATPRYYNEVSVLFTDFKGFTEVCEKLTPEELVSELHTFFLKFDEIIEKYNLEKIKTIGDSYMCAGGIPIANSTHPIDIVKAGLEIQQFMNETNNFKKKADKKIWELRLGIHTGEIIAGVVGRKKFAYDIWGDTVNIASRMESAGEPGKVNISGSTFEFIKDYFDCEYRGEIEVKNKGKIDMFFVNGLKQNPPC